MRDKNIEKKKRRQEYWDWLKTRNETFRSQVSYGRSGRHWLAAMIRHVCDIYVHSPNGWKPEDPFRLQYVHDHIGIVDYAKNVKTVLLIRDPRDAFLSEMYHHVYISCIYETMKQCVENFLPGASTLDAKIRSWASFFEKFLTLDTIVVQYEHICLFPEETIARICQFLDLDIKRNPEEVIKESDSVVQDKTNPVDYIHGRYCNSVEFSNRERYEAHCLKWQEDELITRETLDYIWKKLGHIMIHWGYSQTGHTTNLRKAHFNKKKYEIMLKGNFK